MYVGLDPLKIWSLFVETWSSVRCYGVVLANYATQTHTHTHASLTNNEGISYSDKILAMFLFSPFQSANKGSSPNYLNMRIEITTLA